MQVKFGRIYKEDTRDFNFRVSAIQTKSGLPLIDKKRWWSDGWHGDQGRTSHCFLEDALVTLSSGEQIPISDVKIGDIVVTHTGNTKRVAEVIKNEYTGILLKIKYALNAIPIVCTPEHPFYVSKIKTDWGKGDTYGKLTISESGWCKAKNLMNDRYYLRQYTENIKSVSHNKCLINSKEIYFDFDFGRFIGLYLAEGYQRREDIFFAFHKNEKDFQTYVFEWFNKLDMTSRITIRENVNTAIVSAYNKKSDDLNSFLLKFCNKHSDGKRLPNDYLSYPEEFLRGVIQGFTDGDGWIAKDKKRTVLTTTSTFLARQLYRILLQLGENASLQIQNQKGRKTCYRIVIHNVNSSNRRIKDGPFLLSEVKEIEKIDNYNGYVYNLEVEDDESYLIDDIAVHNCVVYAWSHWFEDGPVIQDVILGRQKPVFDLQRFYDEAQLRDGIPGSNYEGTTVRAGAKILNKLGIVEEYRWAFTLEEVLNCVSYLGPMVVGTNWYQEMFTPTSSRHIIRPRGRNHGGHAYVINGIDHHNELLRIKNSWGRSWGDDGHAFIRFNEFERLLLEWGEACVAFQNKVNFIPTLDNLPNP